MRIPRSAVVMGLVTAVPFGLAIRDTFRHREVPALVANAAAEPAAAPARSAEPAAPARSAEDERRALEAKAAADRAAWRETAARRMFDAAITVPGPAFHGAELGGPANTAPADLDITADAHHAILAMRATLAGDDEGCSTLVAAAEHAWGKPSSEHAWVDDAHDRRASIDASCSLEIARAEPAAAWVKHLPFDAVGQPFVGVIHEYADGDADGEWTAPGLDGPDVTSVTAVYDVSQPNTAVGKVLGVIVSTSASPATVAKVAEALAARLHAKPTVADDGIYHWKGRVPVQLIADAGALQVVIGEGAR